MKKILIGLACIAVVVAAFFAMRSRRAHESGTPGIAKVERGNLGAWQNATDPDDSVPDFSNPEHPSLKDASKFYNRALVAQHDGNSADALGNYNRAIGLDPRFARAYNNRGVAKQARGDIEGAISDFNKAITLDPKSARAYNNRGVIKEITGDADGALADFDRAIELEPKYAKAYNNRYQARLAKGDTAGAAADEAQAKELIPQKRGAQNPATIQGQPGK